MSLPERLKDPVFRRHMLPHCLRGVGSAGFYYFSLVGLARTGMDESASSYLIAVTALGQLCGGLLLLPLLRRTTSGRLTWAAIFVCAACFVIIPFVRSVPLFLGLYFILTAAYNIENNVIPIGVLRSTATEDLPVISSARMAATSGISGAFVLIFGGMMENYEFIAMLISALLYLAGGCSYARQFTDELNQ